MGRLKTLTILMTLGAWGAATDGAQPDDAANSPQSSRPQPPAPPSAYVKAGAQLLSQGQVELAAKYLKAASDYRDQLSDAERADLDKLNHALATAPTAGPMPTPTPTDPAAAGVGQPAASPSPTPMTMPVAGAVPDGRAVRLGAADAKQRARWLLQQAREQISRAEYDEARVKLDEARALDVKWSLFDDTPTKVAEALAKAQPQTAATATAATAGNRKQARAKLKEARAALAANRYEQAEAIAQEVNGWGLSFGVLDDNPRKIASAARALRERDAVRKFGTRGHAGQEVYDALVRESRDLLKSGKFQEAEAKALRAQKMNVVPALTADRAETVLADISVQRAKAPADGAPTAIVEAPSARAEIVANDLLARNETDAARAKFAEAQQLQAREAGPNSLDALTALAPPATDPAVERVQAPAAELDTVPAPAPPTLTLETAPTEPAPAELPAPAEVAPPGNPASGLPDLNDPAAPAPVAVPEPAPLQETPAPAAAPAANPGELMLGQARGLIIKGNYAEAREVIAKAKAGPFGVEAKADELSAQVAQAEQAGALSLFEAALSSLRKNDTDRARALLNEINASEVQLDEGLAQRVQDLLMKLPKSGDGKATATDLASSEEAVKAQQVNAEIGTKLAEARRQMETDPDRAISSLQSQVEAVKAAGLSESVTKTYVRRLEVAIEGARKDKVAFDVKMRDKQFKEEIEKKRYRILMADNRQKEQIKIFMDRGTEAMAKAEYAEAEKFAEMAQQIAPNEPAAAALAWKARVQRHYEIDLKTRSLKEETVLNALQEVDKSGIVDPDVMSRGLSYPKNFGDLSKNRRARFDLNRSTKTPQLMFIEQKLNEQVDLNFDKTPLEEVVTHLQNVTGLNFFLDHKSLADEQVVPTTPVSLSMTKVKLKTALKLILRPLNLSYRITDDVVMITSPQTNRTDLVTKAYDVADLVITPHSKDAQSRKAGFETQPGMGGHVPDPTTPEGMAAARGGMGNPTGAGGNSQLQLVDGQRQAVDMSPLVQLIMASVAPGTWKLTNPDGSDGQAFGLGQGLGAPGGVAGDEEPPTLPGSITPFMLNISLIIRHTAEVHEEVVDLLRQLRKLQDLQITVEVRFITLNDNFFEQIGVDFDLSLHSDAAGKGSSFAVNPLLSTTTTSTAGTAGVFGGTAGTTAGTASTASTSGTTGYLINPLRDHTFGNRQPLVVGTQSAGNPGQTFSPDLQIPLNNGSYTASTVSNTVPNVGSNFGIAFLSDLEVYLFLTAAQGDSRSNLVQAPKVTSFNGASASVSSFNAINYVASLFPLIGAGAGSFFPQVSTIIDGVTLSVTPVVSADRRYVRLSLAPFFQTFNGFDQITVPIVAGGGGLGGGGAVANATIQLPRTTVNTVNTTVTVPDGGTVLLGGVKRLREERTEFGTPILSKTPFINRLFRNIGIGRTTDSLMLMVTPRIIILEEEEERLGIPTVPTVSF